MRIKIWILVGLVLVAIVGAAFAITWVAMWPYPPSVKTLEQRGQFGDSFAIFSATISALGFVGIVFTLALQQLQIAQQSSELKRQAARDEANRRRDEIAQYEQLLFRLLEFYKESVASVRISRKGVEFNGMDALSQMLRRMEFELRSRKLHFMPQRDFELLRNGGETEAQRLLLDYMIVETCRVIQYTLIYQRRVLATLRSLLEHLEVRCPDQSQIDTYRALVSSQITHIEIQYIFSTVLIHENESELRYLIARSGILVRDSRPYCFKFHQFLYQHLWGLAIGDPGKARLLAFKPKRSAQIRASAMAPPLANMLKNYGISSPVRTEALDKYFADQESPASGESKREST